MFTKDPYCSVLDWVYELIKLNLDKIKLYQKKETLTLD